MLVLVPLEILGRVDEPVVGGVDRIAVAPRQCDGVDAADDALVLARPEPAEQAHLGGVGLVEHGVVDDEDAIGAADRRPDFLPERFGVGFETGEQAGKGVVRRGIRSGRLDAGGLAGAGDLRRTDRENDVLAIRRPRWVHALKTNRCNGFAQDRTASTA